MIRLLFWIGLVVLVVMAIRAKLRSEVRRHGATMRRDDQPHAGAAVNAEAMARCAHCHLHFPSSEAVRADGLDYCSPAHVRLPPK
ncbi:MAG TPA: PP0621 family protein [Telluria sp.]|nr:PP0621 family protein [Telluria sp.]